ALTFALYGSVSRYGNPNLVHPVISQGKIEAKVRFDFSIEGRRYTAVRVVRRTKGGASTKEARLESEGRTLAGNADDVTARVREILGLDFEQFTTCVALPQGDFARFLHEKPAERQDLLTKLLGVGIYERMGNFARIREAEAGQKARLHKEELERMAGTGEGSRKDAKRRASELEGLKKEIESAEPELEALRHRAEAAKSEVGKIDCEKKHLETIAVPTGVAHLAQKLRSASESLERARAARAEAESALAASEEKCSRLPDGVELRELERCHREREAKRRQRREAERESEKARESFERCEEEKTKEETEERTAREVLENVRRELAAHDLRAHLEEGRPCPVCARAVEKIPEGMVPPALASATKEVSRTERTRMKAERSWQEGSKKHALALERARTLALEIESLEKKLAKSPTLPEIASTLEALAGAEKQSARVRESARAAREAEAASEAAMKKLTEEERRGFRRFDESRDRVAALRPPATVRESLADSWNALSGWAREEIARRDSARKKAVEEAEASVREREQKLSRIAERAEALQVQIAFDRPRDAVVTALARAEGELERIRTTIERADFLRESVEKELEEARVAGALGGHLRSTGFERWLLEEAFRRLVSGATTILKELSSGQYSFEHDDRLNFEVIDHRNADERRSARTLSGGETFLASLALALTLAEQTVELAAEGSARLESLFLDEGFGTLDDETLDIVASAIAELGAQGRVVGVVTHQQNLAATIPVQYRVSKNPVTSTITKVLV
ncbi:MAG: SbcC/MukB-like Walker B domain-containing protein, partial [Vicinamibacteria bacterium]